MKRIKGIVLVTALLMAAQTSMAYNGKIRLNGFSSESEALNAGKSVFQEILNGNQTVVSNEIGATCLSRLTAEQYPIDILIEKRWQNQGNNMEPSFEAVISYQYTCDNVATP